MGKTHKNPMKISKEQIIKIERASRREADIEFGIGAFKSKVHKSQKDYNRRENKRFSYED